jgi:hypothetical protein
MGFLLACALASRHLAYRQPCQDNPGLCGNGQSRFFCGSSEMRTCNFEIHRHYLWLSSIIVLMIVCLGLRGSSQAMCEYTVHLPQQRGFGVTAETRYPGN